MPKIKPGEPIIINVDGNERYQQAVWNILRRLELTEYEAFKYVVGRES